MEYLYLLMWKKCVKIDDWFMNLWLCDMMCDEDC